VFDVGQRNVLVCVFLIFSLFYIRGVTNENSDIVNGQFIYWLVIKCVTAVGQEAVKSECDDAVSLPTDKPVHAGSDSATVMSLGTQQHAGVPPVKRSR